MCGIVGYVGSRPALEILVRGLQRLEYRGYDSSGVAFFRGSNIEIRKSEGKLQQTEKLLGSLEKFADVHCGIGHTRWATHGKPTTQNAHPHRTGHVVLVHNGIIENYQQIRKELLERGHQPASETDSELFGFLVLEEMDRGLSLVEAVRLSFGKLHGQCSVVVMSEREPGTIVGVRNGSPLVIARDPAGGAVLASDAQPIIEINREVVFLEHGDLAIATASGIEFLELATGRAVARRPTRLDWSSDQLDKRGFDHYMLKEIHEQPTALLDTFNGLVDRATSEPFVLADQPGLKSLLKAERMTIVACGTSYYAALLGKYWIERWAGLPVEVEFSSEYRYRETVLGENAVVVAVTQSGETADTLAVIRDVKARGTPTLAITNVRGSSVSREADAVFYTSAGPEIGVAATKSFLAQLLTFVTLAGYLGLRRAPADRRELLGSLFDELARFPHVLATALDPSSDFVKAIFSAAEATRDARGFFFIGRGFSYPIALEGALKLKEIAYVHSEGYAAGELKHGPIAMIDRDMVVVVLAPRDLWRDKTVSNLEEVKARGAVIVGVGDASDQELYRLCDHWIPLATRPLEDSLLPFVLAPVVQLLSYRIAVLKGTDVDKPRNLAKSVTVE